ncbi:PIG-L deacetylase family protein [Alkalimarinus alittae]|uniref:PIG-L family deacetylase n=1 Tax=Alkalimarinus alittae TaxID=2961619 RepID=A0ABY6MZ71_9ALTE|nr:PIG-L deacetylase family protein [Alkalimarinus alittae]UZE95133.1 PIG-L family deacetylase [Alkalimarinus alittae]
MNFEQLITPYNSHHTLPGKKVVVLAPHPDDEVFGCGGTLNQMANAGADITVLIVTDGVLRSEHTHQNTPAAIAEFKAQAKKRHDESIKAAKTLNYPAPIFLGLQDGELLQNGNLANDIKKHLANTPYDLLLAPSIWEMHRDHRAVAQAALTLIKEAPHNCQLAFYEVGVPLLPNYMVDISNSQPQKNEAMQHFQSQLTTQAYADQIRGLNRFRSYTLGPDVTTAEAFHLVSNSHTTLFATLHAPSQCTLALIEAEQTIQNLKARPAEVSSMTRQPKKHKEDKTEIEALRKALIQAQQHTTALQNTLSWRITAPLRALKILYRHLNYSEK